MKQGDGRQQKMAKIVAGKESEEPVEMEDESREWVEETPLLPIKRNWKKLTGKASKSKEKIVEEELCKDPEMQEEEEDKPLSDEQEIRKSKRCVKPVFKLDEEKTEIEDESEKKGKEDTTPPVKKKTNGTRGVTKSKKAEKEAMTTICKANEERGAPKMQKVAQEENEMGIKKKRKPDVKTREGSPAAPYKRGKKKAKTTPALMQIQEEDDVVLPSLCKRKREPKSTSKEKEGKQDEEEDVNSIMPKKGGRDTSVKEGSGRSKVGRGMKSSMKTDAKEEISSPLRRKKKENEKATQTISNRGKKHDKTSKENEDVKLGIDESPVTDMTHVKGKVTRTAKTSGRNAKIRFTKKNEAKILTAREILTNNLPTESGI